MEIPKQLKKEKYRFTPIERKEKSPYEKGWQKNNNHKYNSKILQKHLKNGGNYGVIGGFGNLVIIDADKQEVANQIEKHLPETFTIQTGSGGYHYYYECSSLKNPIRLEENKAGDVGDVQGEGKQVVGPGSIHPNGNRYKIIKDKPIKKIDKENIKFALKNWIEIEEKNKIEQKNKEDYINLPLTDIIDTTNLKESGDEMYGKHPIHGSDTGRNFWINKNKNTWFCFRHNSGGSSLLWLAVKYGVIDCIDAQPGALEGNKYIETIEKADQNNILDAEDFLKREETAQLYKPPEKIQKKLENKNHFFETKNDTECIVHYIADKLNQDINLKKALQQSIKDMDGPFSYTILTPEGIGIAKDPLGLRPAVIGENNGVSAIASEEMALRKALGEEAEISYLSPGEVKTYTR